MIGYWKRGFLRVVMLCITMTGYSWAGWDGESTLDDIDFKPESFLDINSYQFRRSEEINWYDAENGFRISGGSLATNFLYLNADLRLKREITPHLNFRLRLLEEEFYEPREFPRPLLEIELQPTALPWSVSLLGTPAFAKRDSDLGLALTLGERPWNFVQLAWLSSDHYFNEKNEVDGSYYRREPEQLSLDASWLWDERYKMRIQWQDDEPLEFILDDQVAVFAYENQNYRLSFDYETDNHQHFGIRTHGFKTIQSLTDNVSPRSQDIRYYSVDGYWIKTRGLEDEWTVGLRYDDFVNIERTASNLATAFDFSQQTTQIYTTYHHPFSSHQAWELGLYLGHVTQARDYLDTLIADAEKDRIEAKLRTGWEMFAIDQSTVLTLALSFNLDEIASDVFDGGSMRLSTRF